MTAHMARPNNQEGVYHMEKTDRELVVGFAIATAFMMFATLMGWC